MVKTAKDKGRTRPSTAADFAKSGSFVFLASRDPHDLDGVADHDGGATLALRDL
jgi:hypothetical protein